MDRADAARRPVPDTPERGPGAPERGGHTGGPAGPGAPAGPPVAGDPAALARIAAVWAHGWARSRATPPPRAVLGGYRIEVGRPRHAARYVLPAADPAVLRELARTVAPDVWLKICAPRDRVAPLLTGAWRYDEPQYLMTAPLPPSPPDTVPPPGYRLVTEECDGILDVRILVTGRAAADRPAASGRTALTGGTGGAPLSAVHDLIGTEPEHRRRGLGRLVMAALTAHAVRRGAFEAVLVAGPPGRNLYTALGWHLRSPVTAVVREG
ncbi:GNAT family N-acetyltransferase [Streptomyces sp. BBFR2]|uniref:GNAT family N-acetyltransferase n=1 Tax=Streptomyces sp. BBFR2 TaxID=3372854 RepID=UPI0037DA040E